MCALGLKSAQCQSLVILAITDRLTSTAKLRKWATFPKFRAGQGLFIKGLGKKLSSFFKLHSLSVISQKLESKQKILLPKSVGFLLIKIILSNDFLIVSVQTRYKM